MLGDDRHGLLGVDGALRAESLSVLPLEEDGLRADTRMLHGEVEPSLAVTPPWTDHWSLGRDIAARRGLFIPDHAHALRGREFAGPAHVALDAGRPLRAPLGLRRLLLRP